MDLFSKDAAYAQEDEEEYAYSPAKAALQNALSVVRAIRSLKPVSEWRLAECLGLSPVECETAAFSTVMSGLKSSVAEVVQDESTPTFVALQWRYVSANVWCNGMQLVLTHIAPPLENGRQVVGPIMQHPTAKHLLQAWPIGEPAIAVARQFLLDSLQLPIALFDACFDIVNSADVAPVVTEDIPHADVPGLKMVSAIAEMHVQIKNPTRLSAFGLPQGSPFSIGGSRGPSYWTWRHIEASPQQLGVPFIEAMRGRIDDDELQDLAQKVGTGLRLSWLRRPVFDSDTMLLSVQRLGEKMPLPPCILQLGQKLGSGAGSQSTADVLNALSSNAAHPKGDVLRSDSGTWGAVQLVLPNFCWGEDARIGESVLRPLRDLVRDCYDAGIGQKFTRDPAQQDGNSSKPESGSSWILDDTMELLRDVFGVRGPLAKLMACNPSDAGTAFETDIFEAHCIEDIIEELGNDDPLPPAALESLPWVSQKSPQTTTSLTDSLVAALEKLLKVQDKLTERVWYKKKPWCTRSCLSHGSLDSACVLVSGLRQFWLAGFDDDAGPTEAPLIDLAQLCASLLLEDCQLPCVSKVLPALTRDTEVSARELADWLQVEEQAIADVLEYEIAQTPVRAFRTVAQISKFASKMTAVVNKTRARGDKTLDQPVDVVRGRCRLSRSSTLKSRESLKFERSGQSGRKSHRSHRSMVSGRRNSASEVSEAHETEADVVYTSCASLTSCTSDGFGCEEPASPTEANSTAVRRRRGPASVQTEEELVVQNRPVGGKSEPNLGKRHRVIFVNKRSEAKDAFLEAARFSQALVDRIPACLLGEPIGPPPDGLVSCLSKALLWAWEVQGVALSLMADRLSASEGGAFTTPVQRSEPNANAKIIASGMLPLLVATVNIAWNVSPWQRPWALCHAEMLAKKLTQTLEEASNIVQEKSKSRRISRAQVSEPAQNVEAMDRASIAARALPDVHFEEGHRLLVKDPEYFQSDGFLYQQNLAGEQVVRRAVFGSVGATVGGSLDSDEFHDTATARAFLGFPSSIVGIGIEESRAVRRKAEIPEQWDAPAKSRQKVRKQHDLFSDKLNQRLDGTVMVAESISSEKVDVKLVDRFANDLVEDPHEFRFRCGEYSGRGLGYIWESENRYRIVTTQALVKVVDPADHFIRENVKYSWCYVSDDGITTSQGEGSGEAIASLQKMLHKLSGVQTFAKGHSLPGTLHYMSYRTEVILDPVLIVGEAAMEGAAESYYPSRTLALVAGGSGNTLEQQEASKAGIKLKQKRCVPGGVMVRYVVGFSASRNITLYPVGARIRIFSADSCQNEGPSATILELQTSGEYSIRIDGSGEILHFDPDDWNHEVAGVYRYAPKQRLIIHQNGAWVNATVIEALLGNKHALEVNMMDAVNIIQIDLNEMNHAPAWLSVLEFERVARRYVGSIKESCGFVSDPVTGQSLDILKQPFCVSRLGAQEGRDAWLDLASTLEAPKQRASGVLETDGVLIWGEQGTGKTTLARRLAMGCIHCMGGLLPILITAGMLMEHLHQESDPLDMVLWHCHGGGGVAAEIYIMLRQAVYCRRIALIIDEADGADEKWWPLMSYMQCLVELGHTVIILATPGPNGPKSISQNWLHEEYDRSKLVPKAPQAIHTSVSSERPSLRGRSLSVRTSGQLLRNAAVNLLELEIRALTDDDQREAVAARLGTGMVSMFEGKFGAASDFCRSPFGLAFLFGYAGLASSERNGREEKELYLVEWLQAAIDAVLQRCLLLRLDDCNQDAALFDSKLSYCAQVLELIGMEARRLSCHELLFEHLSDFFWNESRDLRSAWTQIVELMEERQLKLLVSEKSVKGGTKEDQVPRSSIRFNHSSLRDYFAARCVMRCLREGRQSLLPSLETILFDSTWNAYLRFIFELVELNNEPVTLDFSETVLGHERLDNLMAFMSQRNWRCPCLRLELAGKDNLPNVDDLDSLLQAGSHALDWLSIRCSPLGLSGIEVLGKALARSQPALIHLDVRNCTVGADGMERLARYLASDRTLTYLNVGSNQLGAEGAGHLAKALQRNIVLEVLMIENNGIGSEGVELIVHGISTGSQLLSLGLSTNRLGDDGSIHAANLLQRNLVLKELDMGVNHISGVGMHVLSLGLLQNTMVQRLSLDGNEVGPLGAWHLREILQAGAMLESINLEHNRLGAEGAAHLTSALRSAECKLEHVELRGNRLGLPGAKQIGVALSHGRCLRRIGLSSNALYDEGVKVVAQALRGNEVLQDIDLSENRIGVEGAKALAAALSDEDGNACNDLRCLRLHGNSIGPNGAEWIAEAFCDGACFKLEHLDIGSNAIEDRGALSLAKAMKHLPALKILELQRNRIGVDGAKALADVVSRKLTLQKVTLHGNFVGEHYFPFVENLCMVRIGGTRVSGTCAMTSKSNDLSAVAVPLKDPHIVASHFRSGLQLEVLSKLKRFGLPQPKPLGDMLDRMFGDALDSSESQDWITASPTVSPRRPYLAKPKKLRASGEASEVADSRRSSRVSLGGDVAPSDETELPPPSNRRRVSLVSPTAIDAAWRSSEVASGRKKSAVEAVRRKSAAPG